MYRDSKLDMPNVKLKGYLYALSIAWTLASGMPIDEAFNSTGSFELLSSNYSNTFFSKNFETQNISRTDDFSIVKLPVDADEDTLVVAARDESENLDPGGSDREKHNPKIADSIIDAEHDRDVAMAKHAKNTDIAVLEISDDDVDEFRKQLNMSSSVLDDIMDAETGRDETLTDIMFRPESEFEGPQFAFLAAARPNSTREELGVEVKGNGSRGVEYVELVEARAAGAGAGDNSSAYQLANVTGYEVEDDRPPDTRFTDVQTLFLACFGTLLPLLLALLALLLVRCVVRRWWPRCCAAPGVASSVSEASEEKDDKHEEYKPVSLPPSRVVSSDVRPAEGAPPPPAANGSIITMTLKNNHLIVETEERNDITKNGRETKMKYSPDSDGIFVVEVQQSAPYRPNNKGHPPLRETQISSNQHALVHRASEDEIIDIDEPQNKLSIDKEKSLALSNTGLSISDLSLSSVGSHNPSYSYGSQTGYEQGPFGYPVYSGYDIPKEPSISEGMCHDSSREPLISKTPTDPDKPVVTAAIFKQDSIIGNDILQGPGYCIEGSTDGPLLSDVQAREVSLHQLHDKMDKKLENGQADTSEHHSPKKYFNRADSLPPRLGEDKSDIIAEEHNLETIGEDEEKTIKEVTKNKRASLPTITNEVFQNVKESLIPNTSPKFEKLTNASSPEEVQSGQVAPPMITITEEHDNPGYQTEVESTAS